jgi:hypothetical protein
MKNKSLTAIALLILAFLTYACSGNNLSPAVPSNPSSTPTVLPALIPSQTPTPLPTLTPTPTLTPQTLGRIFPEGFHGQAVWSDGGGNKSDGYKDQEWHCPPDSSTTVCTDHVMHFDVSLPQGFTKTDKILSPVDGLVVDIYDVGAGEAIVINPTPPFAGVPELLNNRDRINVLSKGIFKFDYSLNAVKFVSLHLAHVLPLVSVGDRISRKQPIATIDFDVPFTPKKVAYVIYIHMNDGNYYQFGPCDVPNDDEFCGKCTAGSPYPCP